MRQFNTAYIEIPKKQGKSELAAAVALLLTCGCLLYTSQDYITKQTAVDPSGDGMDVWEDALQTFFQGDNDLIRYVQEIVCLLYTSFL